MKSVKKEYFIIGIDEAGRGPLAGPLVVGGVLLVVNPAPFVDCASHRLLPVHKRCGVNNHNEEWKILEGIRDSKKLSAKKREEWFVKIKKHPQLYMAHAIISPKVIDKINIYQAANLGALKVLLKLRKIILNHNKKGTVHLASGRLLSGLSGQVKILLDGGLKLPSEIEYQTIIKGDEKIPNIAAASIVAKVIRDRIMRRLHKKFPEYGFDRHKGYGTKMHKIALAKFGTSALHRKSFSVRM